MKTPAKLGLRHVLGSLAAGLLLAPSAPTLAQEETIEEIVVTGSYIKRENRFDTASPVDVLDLVDLSQKGQVNLGEIMRNQSFSYGVDTVTNIIGATPTTGTFSFANLRGLGAGATLTLLNGRRSATGNVQALYPRIMLQRIETLTDGGSATYGSDAVAGVVNLIPRERYEGVEVHGSYNTDSEGDYDSYTWGILGGTSSDRTDIVVALQFRERSTLKFLERPDLLEAMVSSSGDANPGNWLVPQRDATGALLTELNADGETVVVREEVADPGCGLNNTGTATKTEPLNQRTGFLAFGACRYEFGEFFNFIAPQTVFQGMTTFEHRFTDFVSFEGELLFSRQQTDDTGSPTNPGGQLSQLGIVPGDHPGNPYRAMTDTDGDGVLDALLFAQDANSDGAPDRDANGQVVLAADPFDPASGIPFNEDVLVSQWRPITKALNQPTRTNSDGSGEGDFSIRDTNFRWAGRLNVDIPDTSWSTYLDVVWHRNVFQEHDVRVESLSALRAGVQGDLFVNGETHWFNPFSTQDFACVNRDCSGFNPQTDPEAINSLAVLDKIFLEDQDEIVTTLNTVSLVATGNVAELPAGPLGIAFGGEWLYRDVESNLGAVSNARDAWIEIQRLDWNENRDTYGAFVETRVPVFDNDTLGVLEFNGSVRYTDSNDSSNADLSSTDFKVAARWQPLSNLALRGSIGTAFIAPSLTDLFEPDNFQLSNVADPLFGRGSTFKARGVGGNPNLTPEEADIYNVGFSLNFLDGDLSLSFDWMSFEFEDRIVRPIPTDILLEDLARFQAALAAGLVASNTEWALNNDNIDNDPTNAGEDARIFRNPTSLIIERISTPLINATEMTWEGFDLQTAYSFASSDIPFTDAEFGTFDVSLQATYVDDYLVTPFAGDDPFQAAGNRNDDTGFVPPIPRWRGILSLGWQNGRHAAVVIGRYTHHVNEDDNLCALPGFVLAGIGARPGCPERIPSQTMWDVQYNLNLDGLIWGDRHTSLTVGAVNLFDTFPPPIATLGGMEVFLYDPRGRQLYLRFQQEF